MVHTRMRHIDRSAHQVNEYPSVARFLRATHVYPGVSTITHNGLPIDVMIKPGESDTLIFFFHGAIEPHFTLPVLSGQGISDGLMATRVFISDPSLVIDKDLLLGWYAGNTWQPDLQKKFILIIRKIQRAFRASRLIFFGGSGGGFASLYMASFFRNSTAIVFNAQTDIRKYTPKAVADFFSKAFQRSHDEKTSIQKLPNTVALDLCHRYSKKRRTKIFYMQNENDVFHMENHLTPFMTTMHPKSSLYVLVEPWGPGHSPPPKYLLESVLHAIDNSTAGIFDWRSLGFMHHRRVAG